LGNTFLSASIPFQVAVSETIIEDLHTLLVNTRWPDEPNDAGWDYYFQMMLNHSSGVVALHVNIRRLRTGIEPDEVPLPDEETTWLGVEKKHLRSETPFQAIK
jgi:hypothetical protein